MFTVQKTFTFFELRLYVPWALAIETGFFELCRLILKSQWYMSGHGLRTSNEGINQRYLKNWAIVADKICCRHT